MTKKELKELKSVSSEVLISISNDILTGLAADIADFDFPAFAKKSFLLAIEEISAIIEIVEERFEKIQNVVSGD